jgi:Zn-dependent M28 family amino/carboxypeptidase
LLALVACALLAGPPAGDAGGDAERLRELAGRLFEAVEREGQAWERLAHLTDRIGPRLSGSPGAEAAVRWTAERLAADGLAVRTEPILVPTWVRGLESAELLAPVAQRLAVTALGGSDPTPEAGIAAEVVEVASFEELAALPEGRVAGRIVLFNRAIADAGFQGYSAVAPLRTRGAVEAAKRGAVAALVRSLGTLSARLPHTGAMSYGAALPRIPAAAIAAEDAELIHRLLAAGDVVRLRLVLGCRTLPDAPSANVVADLPGRERPEEIVLIGAHLDSWDLGTGAIDDGAGVAMVMEALRLLKASGLAPRRTIRGVLFMNEENGLRGGRGYAEAHAAELPRHVAAVEADSGAGALQGIAVTVGEGGLARLRALAPLLRPAGAEPVTSPGGGADIGPLREQGVPVIGMRQDAARYFDWHHTAADTLDKVDRAELARNSAAMAVLAWALAEMEPALPRPGPAPPGERQR